LNNVLILPAGQEEAETEKCTLENELSGIFNNFEVYYIYKVFKDFWPQDTLMTLEGGVVVGANDLSQIFLLRLKEGHDIFDLIPALWEYPDCYFAEPNGYLYGETEPNDTYYEDGYQWNLWDWNPQEEIYGIGALTAWNYSLHYNVWGVPIGFIDSGIDYNHPDLSEEEYPNLRILQGYDFLDNDIYPYSRDIKHATATTGIAAAITNNDRGIASVCGSWYLNPHGWTGIYPFRTISDQNKNIISDDCEAIRTAADPNGLYACPILSNSYGHYQYSEAMRGAVCYANIAGASFVASKGNNGTNQYHIPSDIDGSWVISVGAYIVDGTLWPESNYGNNIDLVAPGAVVTTTPNSSYQFLEGTSLAVPHVSASAAIIQAFNLYSHSIRMHPDDIDRILCYSAIDDDNPGYDDYYGHGRLNIGNAMNRLVPDQPVYPPWQLFRHRTEPAEHEYNEVYYGFGAFNHKAPYDLPTGRYCYRKYEVLVNVEYDEIFLEVPKVWGRGMNVTKGWSPAIPNNMAEYCGVVPNSERIDGCQLQTFVYEIWSYQRRVGCLSYLGWYPCRPEEVECEYTIWGRLDPEPPPPPPLHPDSINGKASITIGLFESREETYPNPFNSAININVSIPHETNLCIVIYDIAGRNVGQIRYDNLTEGSHEFNWIAQDNEGAPLPSGLYFLRFNYPERAVTKRVILLR
jgi:hypothetical protein